MSDNVSGCWNDNLGIFNAFRWYIDAGSRVLVRRNFGSHITILDSLGLFGNIITENQTTEEFNSWRCYGSFYNMELIYFDTLVFGIYRFWTKVSK